MTGSFRERFDRMVATLRAHPQVEVYEAVVRPGASEEELVAIEAALKMPLPTDMRTFYAAHDGVFLEWGRTGRTYDARTAPFGYPDYGQPPGCINLLPVSEAMSPQWQSESHVNEISAEHQALLFGDLLDPEPEVGAVCVDNFSKYNHGDLIFGPEPVMVVSTDHGADMDSSDYTTFSVYLDVMLALWGANRYRHGLGIGWSRTSRRVEAWTARPSLDELLNMLDDDE